MRCIVAGGTGMLGTDLRAELLSRGVEVAAPVRSELDVTDPESVARVAAGEYGPFDWLINCSAYTAVDKAETERREATELNTFAPGYLANAARMAGAKFLHVSTDFVFDGSATSPYPVDAPTKPLGVYGFTKREGEEAARANNPNTLIVRTAWLYGPNGNSFPRTMIRAFLAGKNLRVVADQIGCPTYTADLAQSITQLVQQNAFPGIYHAVGPEAMSWHEFAGRAINAWQRIQGLAEAVEIQAVSTEEWPTPAKRPKYSVLQTEQAMRPVDEALEDFCRRLGEP